MIGRIAPAALRLWQRAASAAPRLMMPFADAATKELPMSRLLRLSMFQISVGMAVVLIIGTLNRVMIVELGVSAWIVAVMISLPLLFAPLRALIGFRSDVHRSYLGLRRLPYMILGTMLQWGGFAIMPMALIVLSGDSRGPEWLGPASAALAFLLVGAGLHTTQTVGLALATDLAPAHARPKVVALLCAMLLVGMVISAVVFGWLLADFSPLRLIQVIQGAAVVTLLLNTIALWKQEPRATGRMETAVREPGFKEMWAAFDREGGSRRRLFALGLGTAAFSMQDVLLEPYGGEILKLSVGSTTALTGLLAIGGVVGLMIAARQLGRGADPYRVAANGALIGIAAFSAVVCSAPLQSWELFAAGVTLIGLGGGLFAHATLTAAMEQTRDDKTGFALGVWGSVQATAAGLAIACGGIVRDGVGYLATRGHLGEALADPVTGYSVVYHIEIGLLFCALVAMGRLVRRPLGEHTPHLKDLELAGSRG
jgi:BCD family chlorophyll transporter-like MFS transporter